MKKIMILCAMALFVSACYKETEGNLSIDATLDTSPDGSGEICDNGVDDDGDTLADCGDPECASVCPDASTDASPDAEDDSPAEEICDNGVDDDGDGLADCGDIADCGDFPGCESDASTDALEDPAPDVDEDPVADPVPDPDPDPSEDPVEEDLTAEEVSCSPTPGEVTLTWTVPSGWIWDRLRAECWVLGTHGVPDSWNSTWLDPMGTADAMVSDDTVISYTLSFAPGASAFCNFAAFDLNDTGDAIDLGPIYSVGSYSGGSYTTSGSVTASTDTCDRDITPDLTVLPEGTGPACNWAIVLP